MLMLAKAEQSSNARSTIVVTPSGMTMLVREEHPENAAYPIVSTLDGMLISLNALQSSNPFPAI